MTNYPFALLTQKSPLIDAGGQEWNIKSFGAQCNGQASYTGVATSGSATLTDASASFNSALIGRTFTMLSNSVGSVWTGTITAVPSPTTLTISATSPFNSQLASSSTGTINNGSNNLTDGSGAFQAAWDGAIVTIQGAGPAAGVLTGMLQAVASATSLYLCQLGNSSQAVNASTTVTGNASYTINYGQYTIGTDDTAAWNAAFTAAQASLAPKRIYWTGVSHISTMLVVPQNCVIVGDNMSATVPVVSIPVNGSILRAHGTFTGAAVVTFGPSVKGNLESSVSASSGWCTIDARGMVTWAAIMAGSSQYLDHVNFRSGTTGCVNINTTGQGGGIFNQCTVAGIGVGDGLFVQGNDWQWHGGFLRNSVNQVHLRNCVDFKMTGAHLFSGFGDSNLAVGNNVLIDTTAGNSTQDIEFIGCDFDDSNGATVNIVPAASTTISEINLVGCQTYQNPSTIFTWPNNTYPVVQVNITAASSVVTRLNLFGGSAISNVNLSLFTAVIAVVGAGGTFGVLNVSGYNATFCNNLLTGQAPVNPAYSNIFVNNGTTVMLQPPSGAYLCPPTAYAPAGQTSFTTVSATLAAVSSANISTGSFVVPLSGKVMVTVGFMSSLTAVNNVSYALAAHGTVTPVIGNTATWQEPSGTSRPRLLKFLVTGLTAGNTVNLDLLFAVAAAATLTVTAIGGTSTTPTGTTGVPVTMEVQAI